MMSRQPGFLALPGQKAKWQSQVQQQQSVLSRLQNRLETVKEIHDGMGLHGPRIHELATAKVRHDKPELAEGWDEMRAAQRAHENLMRKQAKEQKEKLQREQAPSLSKGNGLSAENNNLISWESPSCGVFHNNSYPQKQQKPDKRGSGPIGDKARYNKLRKSDYIGCIPLSALQGGCLNLARP
ncbi:IncP plasmid survival protein KfrC family protein [Enterobacter kobei]|uniref:IncP plasmid survival protein KfrC family protein n=1 Tax=Enterobacter kobei TaxID=208224 RepID=UPI00388FEEF7